MLDTHGTARYVKTKILELKNDRFSRLKGALGEGVSGVDNNLASILFYFLPHLFQVEAQAFVSNDQPAAAHVPKVCGWLAPRDTA